ncbi:MAG: translation initiation factor, partial [Deltaproteobacteria bacterium]|nr:translation initiation factor [Deltaproteobacteria bacterium]
MENKDLLKLLEKMGVEVKSVHSTLDDSDIERVKNHLNLSRKEGLVEQRVKPTVIRRRVKKEEALPAPEPATPIAAQRPVEKPTEKKAPAPETPRKEEPPPVGRPLEKKAVEAREEAPSKLPEEVLPPLKPAPAPAMPLAAEEKREEEGIEEIKPVVGLESIPAAEKVPEFPAEAKVVPSLERPKSAPVERAKILEKPPEKPAAKPKKKHEPAKILERPATPPPSLVTEYRPMPSRTGPPAGRISGGAPGRVPAGPPRAPGAPPSRPPSILPRQAAGTTPAKPVEEEERGRRRKRFKKDVQVLEEGKPNRTRVITTKKRAFKEYDFIREVQDDQTLTIEFEPRSKSGRPRMGKTEITVPKPIKRKIRISEAILVGELAKRMGIKGSEIIKKLMELGMMVTINQAIDAEAASLVATEFGYEIEKTGLEIEDLIEEREEHSKDLIPRPPVVTIMGHVDHGKTSLLDAIRQTNVTAGEAGGITQHIGAYEVEVEHRRIVFLDTPGHEAFTAMRARGAKVTDIVVLVVAADDGVMTQTIEAINHAKAAKVPLIVAINKIDKPNANPERVKQALTEYGLVPEAWGGETIFAEISAKQKIGLKELLEMILLQADVLELKANPTRTMSGTVVESKLDKGRGPVATVLVQDGSLHIGDAFVSGIHFGHVRAMINDRSQRIESAGPSTPVEVIGFDSVPNAGDSFVVVTDEKRAKELATQRLQKQREIELAKSSKVTLEDFYKKMQKGVVKDLNLILKADVQGSVEAVTEALSRLSTDAVHVNLLHSSVGAINESDCMLASASEAIILGFNVKTEPKAQALAEQEKIDIRLYNIIYDAIEDVRKAMEGLLEPIFEERLSGRAEIRQIFNISRIGVVAGCAVLEGKIIRGSHSHLVRGGKMIYEATISSLKRMKDDVREVQMGFECGITLGDFRDYQVNDIIES